MPSRAVEPTHLPCASPGKRAADVNSSQLRQCKRFPEDQGRDVVVLRDNTGRLPVPGRARRGAGRAPVGEGDPAPCRTARQHSGGTRRRSERLQVGRTGAGRWSWPTEGRCDGERGGRRRPQRGVVVALWTCPGSVDPGRAAPAAGPLGMRRSARLARSRRPCSGARVLCGYLNIRRAIAVDMFVAAVNGARKRPLPGEAGAGSIPLRCA